MSAPFQPGDVVVRIHDVGNTMPVGTICRVSEVGPAGVTEPPCQPDYGIALHDRPHPRCWMWAASQFRKIDADVTEEFRQALRTLKTPETADA